MKLSVKKVERINEAGRYGDGRGLYLQVTPGGSKSWLYRFERGGRGHAMGLGSALDFTLDEARERAREARRALADGRDPLAERKAARAAAAQAAATRVTFKEATERYYADKEGDWKNRKAAAQFLSTLKTYAFPIMGTLAVDTVDTATVIKVLDPIWNAKQETAKRIQGRIENVLDWCGVRDFRAGPNPARWRGHLDKIFKRRNKATEVRKHPALPYDQIAKFMTAVEKREAVAALALRFTILTAARTNEVTGARWSEIDLERALWVIPKERMKASKEHRVPLTDAALAVLKAAPRERGNDHVFVGGKAGAPLSNMAMAVLLKRMARTDITVHGFRSTFRDWAAEETHYANHVVEMALAHTISSATEAAYRRGDLLEHRKRLMTDWATYCAGQAPAGGNVVQLRA